MDFQRSARRDGLFHDPKGRYTFGELRSVDAIAITQQKFGGVAKGNALTICCPVHASSVAGSVGFGHTPIPPPELLASRPPQS